MKKLLLCTLAIGAVGNLMSKKGCSACKQPTTAPAAQQCPTKAPESTSTRTPDHTTATTPKKPATPAKPAPKFKTGKVHHFEDLTTKYDDKPLFDQILAEHENVVVDFHATWCGPCKTLGSHLQALAPKYPGIFFVKIDTQRDTLLAKPYNVRSIPRMIWFKNGKKVEDLTGLVSQAELQSLFKSKFGL